MTDFRLLLVVRLLRAFGFGFAAVLIGVHLEHRGLSAFQIGFTLSLGLLAGAAYGVLFAIASSVVGRRPALVVSGLFMAAAGFDLAFAHSTVLLMLAGVTGMLGAASVDIGPFSAVEQAVLAESVPSTRRNLAFARYSLTGGAAAALGALVAGLASSPALIQASFIGFAAIGLLTGVLPALLSKRVEAPVPGPTLSKRSTGPLTVLSGLFALDSFGGGFVVQAVIAYWLHARFHAGTEVIGPLFAAIAVMQTISYEVSGRLANQIGLVRTMVFTHLPSNILLLLVPLSPTLPIASFLLLLRFSMSQMDVPARQAYIVSIVPPSERAGAVAATSAVRGVMQAIGPALAGQAIQVAAYGVPFFVAGGVKIIYDLLLYAGFRQRRAEHEVVRISQ